MHVFQVKHAAQEILKVIEVKNYTPLRTGSDIYISQQNDTALIADLLCDKPQKLCSNTYIICVLLLTYMYT
jgi:hypothetical protein